MLLRGSEYTENELFMVDNGNELLACTLECVLVDVGVNLVGTGGGSSNGTSNRSYQRSSDEWPLDELVNVPCITKLYNLHFKNVAFGTYLGILGKTRIHGSCVGFITTHGTVTGTIA